MYNLHFRFMFSRSQVVELKIAKGLKGLIGTLIILLAALAFIVAIDAIFKGQLSEWNKITILFVMSICAVAAGGTDLLFFYSAYLDRKKPVSDDQNSPEPDEWWWKPTKLNTLESLKQQLILMESQREVLRRERLRLGSGEAVDLPVILATKLSLRFLEGFFEAYNLDERIENARSEINRIVSGDVEYEIRDIETAIEKLTITRNNLTAPEQKIAAERVDLKLVDLRRELADLKQWKEKIAPTANKHQKLYKEEWEPREHLKHQAPVDEAYSATRAAMYAASRLKQVHRDIDQTAAFENWPPDVTASVHRMAERKFSKFYEEPPAAGLSIYTDGGK